MPPPKRKNRPVRNNHNPRERIDGPALTPNAVAVVFVAKA